ncbi:MAG: EamA family transporter [Flavisolibacter sp.]|nr:EamA family transporter [Flavisolibacter sp.]MBD0349852.1 EamA family transporter [Flavisolibacter sp.]
MALFYPLPYTALAAVAITGTFLTYYFNACSIQHLGAGKTSAYIYTQPVFAILIAILFLSKAFTLYKLVAALLIFTGVFLVNIKRGS